MSDKYKFGLFLFLLSVLGFGCGEKSKSKIIDLPYSKIKPKVIHLDLPAQDEGIGGLITADVTDDGQRDFIITKPGHIVVYDHSGEKLWSKSINIQVTKKSETYGLPGWHGPGVQAADIDGDQKTEVLFLTKDNTLYTVQGANGEIKGHIKIEAPQGAEHWEHLVVANFRGKGDRDLLLQATNADGYRMGRYVAAYSLGELMQRGDISPLWTRDDFVANAHNGARVADMNGDGKDEVLGGTILSPDGELLFRIPLRGHIDSLFVADVRPDIQGLEVVALEEGGGNQIFNNSNRIFWVCNRILNRIFGGYNHVFLYNDEGLIWASHYKHQEPQNTAVGDFDPSRPGLEVWCRSHFNEHQKPFVFDAQGKHIAHYEMDDVAPKGWTIRGVEVIFSINWTGTSSQLAAAKERHESGDICIFDPISGKFLHRFKENADRLYVADMYGDWREELIVLNGNELHI